MCLLYPLLLLRLSRKLAASSYHGERRSLRAPASGARLRWAVPQERAGVWGAGPGRRAEGRPEPGLRAAVSLLRLLRSTWVFPGTGAAEVGLGQAGGAESNGPEPGRPRGFSPGQRLGRGPGLPA